MLPPFPSPFRNSTFLLNRSEVGLGGRGTEAGHGLRGRVDEWRKPLDSEKHREPEGDYGQEGNGSGNCAVEPHAPPNSIPKFPHLVLRRRISREPRSRLTGAVALQWLKGSFVCSSWLRSAPRSTSSREIVWDTQLSLGGSLPSKHRP